MMTRGNKGRPDAAGPADQAGAPPTRDAAEQGGAPQAQDGAAQRAREIVDSLFRDDRASRALGIEILEVGPGRVRIAMTVRPDMVNGFGMCHGGIVFAFADSAFAFACNSRGDPMVAAGASIEFLAPTPLGARLTATATETSRNERHGIYDVSIASASGTAIAHFRGRCARYKPVNPGGSSGAGA
ncbi:MAG TPA: hydroxyphenylacetyl-CoA thioesterase PaaI [Steroidobacteraceae bacterium]|jgi:acyl-CoA thioesterase|nr:hydroxyphenylacetyl-CoA thioesterase PaaI [Steroidobacteraceae bacterium]